jgi:hypothetical protein
MTRFAALLARVGEVCLALPDTREVDAWHGVRWEVRGRTFAHLLTIEDGRPATYARLFGTAGPAVALTFWAEGPERDALRSAGPPYVAAPWSANAVGLLLGEDAPGWDEVAELLVESHRVRHTPRRAARKT